ncbi:MAG: hypothetical protein ABIR51_03440 [Sphingomicrobium sp.]
MGSPLLLLLAAAASPASPAAPVSAAGVATVRILVPALVGEGLPAPRPGMTPHDSSITLPNGQSAPIRLYEFE